MAEPSPLQTRSYLTDIFHGVFSTNVPHVSRHGGHLVAEVLHAHGVKFVFTLVGGHISPFLVESQRKGIRIIDVRHEVNSVFAADAVGRLTGIVMHTHPILFFAEVNVEMVQVKRSLRITLLLSIANTYYHYTKIIKLCEQ